jgi:uncharacterized membrane protein
MRGTDCVVTQTFEGIVHQVALGDIEALLRWRSMVWEVCGQDYGTRRREARLGDYCSKCSKATDNAVHSSTAIVMGPWSK